MRLLLASYAYFTMYVQENLLVSKKSKGGKMNEWSRMVLYWSCKAKRMMLLNKVVLNPFIRQDSSADLWWSGVCCIVKVAFVVATLHGPSRACHWRTAFVTVASPTSWLTASATASTTCSPPKKKIGKMWFFSNTDWKCVIFIQCWLEMCDSSVKWEQVDGTICGDVGHLVPCWFTRCTGDCSPMDNQVYSEFVPC